MFPSQRQAQSPIAISDTSVVAAGLHLCTITVFLTHLLALCGSSGHELPSLRVLQRAVCTHLQQALCTRAAEVHCKARSDLTLHACDCPGCWRLQCGTSQMPARCQVVLRRLSSS